MVEQTRDSLLRKVGDNSPLSDGFRLGWLTQRLPLLDTLNQVLIEHREEAVAMVCTRRQLALAVRTGGLHDVDYLKISSSLWFCVWGATALYLLGGAQVVAGSGGPVLCVLADPHNNLG